MTAVIMVFHSMICIFLIIVILMQSGRGGGLTEAFSSAESVFGAKTSSFMVKATTIIATLFIVTALSLAVLSTKKDRSLMERRASQTLPQELKIPSPASQNAGTKAESEVKTEAQKIDQVQKEIPSVPSPEPAVPQAQPAGTQ